jgi:hypothetical protein
MTVMQQFIFNEELALARAPRPGGIGITMAGPTIIAYGTPEQKQEHLTPMLSGDAIWCQGFSEPESGSDLASLKTRAVRDGDDYVVNGQKIWTTGAQYSDRMILMARTDPDAPKHKGISYFLLDMKAPGVSVRPLVNMAGTPGFNEVFFDNVRIPRKDLLGEENRGWYVGTTTLDFGAVDRGLRSRRTSRSRPRAVGEDNRLARCTRTMRLELAERSRGAGGAADVVPGDLAAELGLVPNHEASAVKIYAAELNQRIQTRRSARPGCSASYSAANAGGGGLRRAGLEQGQICEDVPAGGGEHDRGGRARSTAISLRRVGWGWAGISLGAGWRWGCGGFRVKRATWAGCSYG